MTDTPKTTTELLKQKLYGEQTFTLDDGETEVVVRVNDKVIERIRKYFPVLLQLRGLLGVDSLDESHPDVQKKLQVRAKGNPEFARLYQRRRTLKKADREKYNHYVQIAAQTVQKEHEPAVQLLLFQAVAWAIMYDDLFSFDQAGNPVFRIDGIEIPDSYWTVGVQTDEGEEDPLDKLLAPYTHTVQRLEIDSRNPLEWMLAMVTTLISDTYNPKFAQKIQDLLQKAVYYITLEVSWSDVSVDEAGFLLDELVGNMEEPVQSANTNGQRKNTRRRVRKTDEAAEPGGSGGSAES